MKKEIQKLIIEAAYRAGHGHIPSALSILDIIINVYENKSEEDIFILSKGHGCLALYAYFCYKGVITKEELFNFGKKGSKLGGHPDRNKLEEIYASTGSLGHGLPIAVGAALAKQIKGEKGKVFCLIGDGEANEGTLWESLLIVSKLKLKNLVCIIDYNKSQERSLPIQGLSKKLNNFNLNNNPNGDIFISDVENQFIQEKNLCKFTDPHASFIVIVNTIKGEGVKLIEDNVHEWHHKSPTQEEYEKIIKELSYEEEVC